jgi:serine/threonine-protein kinase
MSITAAPAQNFALAGSIVKGRYKVNAIASVTPDVVVYDAEEVRHGRAIALKVLRDELAADPEFVAAAREQASTLALSAHVHRGLPRVYDCGTTESGVFFVALEPTSGVTLREILQARGELDVPAALHIASQIGEALETLHHSKIVHGSLSPHSVLIVKDHDGTERVTLVGVELTSAYRTASGQGRREPSRAAYLAPEQLANGHTTEASDQYALGLILREMLTTSGAESITPPPDVARIIATALDAAPERRFPDLSVMVNDLWAAQTALAEPAPRPRAVESRASARRRSRERGPQVSLRIAAAVATAGIIAAVVWFALSGAMATRVRALFTTPAVPSVPDVTAAPVSPPATARPAVLTVPVRAPASAPPAAAPEAPPRSRESQTSKKAAAAEALAHPSAAPRPDVGTPVAERPAPVAEQVAPDASDGGAIIDWLLKRPR